MTAISIIGAGWVGTRIGQGFNKLGHVVRYYDIVDKSELPGFTRSLNQAVLSTSISFICVPTPTVHGEIDLQYITSACSSVGSALKAKKEYHVVVIKSTVVPGTTDMTLIPILERASGRQIPDDFGVCVNPEFITQISHTWNADKEYERTFFNEDRIVIGSADEKAGSMVEELYSPLRLPAFRTDLMTAEFIKYAANCMLATKISYWNELYGLAESIGVDLSEVANAVTADTRIGKYGSRFGKAFGGTCLPKDLEAFIRFAEPHYPLKLLKAVDEVNEEMKRAYGVRG